MAQIGVNAWVWSSPVNLEEFSRLAPHVAQMGFDLLEVGIEGIHDLDYEKAAKVARDHGLAVSVCAAMGPDRDLIHGDASVRTKGLAYLHHCIKAAKTIGAPNLVGPMYSAVGRTWQQTDNEARPQPGSAGAAAAGAGGRCRRRRRHALPQAAEPLRDQLPQSHLAGDRGRRPGRPSGVRAAARHLPHERRALAQDAIRAAGARLKHLHTCENDRGAPGSGHVPWEEVAAACRDIGFEGPMVIESFTQKVKSIARAAAIWRPLAETQDALAADGLGSCGR